MSKTNTVRTLKGGKISVHVKKTGLTRPSKVELKKIFRNQCEPCQLDPETCNGNTEKAKEWKCSNFFNGFMVMTGVKKECLSSL